MDNEKITLISEKKIQKRIEELADEINKDYKHTRPIIICILKGAVYFFVDLTRRLNMDPELEFMRVSSYVGEKSEGKINLKIDIDRDISGRDVLIVEDIIDKGYTLSWLYKHLQKKNPHSIKLCCLLDKPDKREVFDVKPDYVGFTIKPRFVIGYGLDNNEEFRTDPKISCIVEKNKKYKKEVQEIKKEKQKIKEFVKKRAK